MKGISVKIDSVIYNMKGKGAKIDSVIYKMKEKGQNWFCNL